MVTSTMIALIPLFPLLGFVINASLGKRLPKTVSGGLASLGDIERLCAVEEVGIEGVICGRAIYSGELDFAAAQARADELANA